MKIDVDRAVSVGFEIQRQICDVVCGRNIIGVIRYRYSESLDGRNRPGRLGVLGDDPVHPRIEYPAHDGHRAVDDDVSGNGLEVARSRHRHSFGRPISARQSPWNNTR